MNILHINQCDIVGGAAIAGYRLHEGLLKQRVNSRLLVEVKKIDSDRIAVVPRKPRIENQIFRFSWKLGFHYVHIVSSFDVPKHPFYQEADILNFHNLHGNYFNYLAIPSLTEQKPAVYTLHDMWSFTGHCAYSYDCDRWKIGCGKCPYPDTYPSVNMDNTNLEWKLKNWIYSKSNLTIVTPSKWLTEQAKQSMLNRFEIHHIPYGIDTEAYQPLDQELCRNALGIPTNKKVLMFGSVSVKDPRKGGDLIVQALQNLPASLKAETVLLTIGNDGGGGIAEEVGMESLHLGYVSSDRLKSIAYSAADLFILPTRADNLPLVLQESLACGTPIVSFKIGGVPDLVRPGITGYLALTENVQDFCNGIKEIMEDKNLCGYMSQQCRAIALKEYSLELQSKRYIELYSKLLHNH
ncbi:MAG TPA: glycosyltransferase family 4 protein [Phormidium sp.]